MGPLNWHFTENTVPIRKINRLILSGETVCLYCESHTKDIGLNTPCGQNAEFFMLKQLVVMCLETC